MGFLDEIRANNQMMNPAPNAFQSQIPMHGTSFDPIKSQLDSIMPFLQNRTRMATADWKDRTQFANNLNSLPVRQENSRNVLDPSRMQNPGQMDVIFKDPALDPATSMTMFQRSQLGLEREKLASGMGDRAEDNELNRSKFELESKKNEQIYNTKLAEMERKSNEAASRLELAERQLKGREDNAMMVDQRNRAATEATNARHALDIAQREAVLDETRRNNDARIKQLEDELASRNAPVTETTELSPDASKKTVTTIRRSATQPIDSSSNSSATPKASSTTPPTPVSGWKWIRNKTNTGWTAVEDK